jgi:hypothetical protein
MATSSIVSTLGAGSGIDVKSLAQNLVDAEKTPRKERIDAKIAQTEAKITGYGAIKFALSELKNAFGKLNDASDFTSIKTINTQASAFGVTTSSEAASGSFNIDVLQTARAQRSVSGSFLARDTPLNTNKPSPGANPFSLRLTVGGVDTRDLSQQTMESKQSGLYFIGEVVDITGWLGGYNFQWAWASAHACGLALGAAIRPS